MFQIIPRAAAHVAGYTIDRLTARCDLWFTHLQTSENKQVKYRAGDKLSAVIAPAPREWSAPGSLILIPLEKIEEYLLDVINID